MTVLRMLFAGEAKKVDLKTVAGKQLLEVSLCRKHKAREGGEDTYSWIKCSIWEPPAFMVEKCVKGSFLAGSGEYQLRSYEKDGVKGHSAEVRCQSFDVEIGAASSRLGESHPPTAVQRPAPIKPAPAQRGGVIADADGPPFSSHQPWSWG